MLQNVGYNVFDNNINTTLNAFLIDPALNKIPKINAIYNAMGFVVKKYCYSHYVSMQFKKFYND